MARFFRRRKFCRFTAEGVKEIDFKDLNPGRPTSPKPARLFRKPYHRYQGQYQRQLAVAIKRARYLALLPYTDSHGR